MACALLRSTLVEKDVVFASISAVFVLTKLVAAFPARADVLDALNVFQSLRSASSETSLLLDAWHVFYLLQVYKKECSV